jgi:hypothetical protein
MKLIKKWGMVEGETIRVTTLRRKSPRMSTAQLQQYPSSPTNHRSDMRRVDKKELGGKGTVYKSFLLRKDFMDRGNGHGQDHPNVTSS